MFSNLQGNKAVPEAGPRRTRGAALALVVAALALLVLKPFCDLAFAAAGNGEIAPVAAMAVGHGIAGHPDPAAPESEACCASIADGTLIKPAEFLISWMPDVSLGAAFIVLAGLLPVAGSRNAARVRFAAPPERSFYIRSARILR